MASIAGLGKIGLPRLSENMDCLLYTLTLPTTPYV